jgi:hypothetical protein
MFFMKLYTYKSSGLRSGDCDGQFYRLPWMINQSGNYSFRYCMMLLVKCGDYHADSTSVIMFAEEHFLRGSAVHFAKMQHNCYLPDVACRCMVQLSDYQ